MADELRRWLRAVRPPTPADVAGWSESADADAQLQAVHRRIAQRRGRRPALRRRVLLPSLATAAAGAAAVLLALGLSSSGEGGSGPLARPGTPSLPGLRPSAMVLANYGSCDDLLAGLRTHTAAHTGPYGLPGVGQGYPAVVAGAAADGGVAYDGRETAPTPTAPAQTSTTNVQEVGVDEPDIVKTDGDRVVTLTDGVLRVLDARSAQVTGSLDLTMYAGSQGGQLLVSGDHAMVLLTASGVTYPGGLRGPAGPGGGDQRTTYLFVDLAGQPKITGSLRADGNYLDARMIGSIVRLVVHSAPNISLPAAQGSDAQRQQRYRGVVAQAPLSAWLPRYTLTEGSTSAERDVPCGQVSHPADYTGASMVTVYTVDLAKPAADPRPVSVVADGDTVYASENSLYVASNPDWFCCVVPSRQPDAPRPTQIHRFDIAGADRPTYLGSGSVPGRLLSSYSLSDYQGHLRVATTSVANAPTAQSSSVYVLDDATLKVTGRVDGLGPGEQIYAVRFIGALGYVVTFRQTDPLYVLDLRDPTAPRTAGELKITGYSDYLHDAGDGRLLGVGQEADGNGRVAGLQVSLFDVHDPAKPTRTAQVVRADAPGEARQDPHAFLYWAPSGLVAFPIQSWQGGTTGKLLVLRVHGAQLSTVGVLANPATSSADGTIQRALIVDGTLWTLSSSGVQVSGQESLDRQAWIPFS